jgi:hypothetical protein
MHNIIKDQPYRLDTRSQISLHGGEQRVHFPVVL